MAKAGKMGMQAAEGTRRAGVGCLCGCHPRKFGRRGEEGTVPNRVIRRVGQPSRTRSGGRRG